MAGADDPFILYSGANLAAAMLITILEAAPSSPLRALPLPVATLWLYPSLDFNFTSWMSSENLKVLRRDKSSTSLPESIVEAKSHLNHRSPLSVVDDREANGDASKKSVSTRRGRSALSLSRSFGKLPRAVSNWSKAITPKEENFRSDSILDQATVDREDDDDEEAGADAISQPDNRLTRHLSLGERVVHRTDDDAVDSDDAAVDASRTSGGDEKSPASLEDGESRPQTRARSTSRSKKGKKKSFGTHLTMTSRTSYFNDRIISPSMMRCMAVRFSTARTLAVPLTALLLGRYATCD